MKTYIVDKPDETVKRIVSVAYPNYRGRKIKLSTSIPSRLDSYWDGGSRDYYVFVHLDTMKAIEVHSNHPFFEADRPRELKALPPRVLIVRHCYFCGKDMGLTIIGNESDFSKLIPENTGTDLTEKEKRILDIYRGIKSFARPDYLRKLGATSQEMDSLVEREYLKRSKNGATQITVKGKNAVPYRTF
jgi:hypothetical protein